MLHRLKTDSPYYNYAFEYRLHERKIAREKRLPRKFKKELKSWFICIDTFQCCKVKYYKQYGVKWKFRIKNIKK